MGKFLGRKYSFILCLALLSSNLILAQPRNTKVAVELENLVSFGEEGYVLIMLNSQDRPTKMSIRLFDHQEQLIEEQNVDLRKQGLITQFEGAFAWNGQLIVMTSLYYPGPKRNHLIFQRYNIPTLEEEQVMIVDEAYSPEQFRIPFGFKKSEDETYLAFYSWTYTLPEDPAKLSVKVYNEAMEEVWTQRYLLPFKNSNFYIYDCAVNSEGKVFIFCENYAGKPGRTIDEEKINYFVLGATAGRKDLTQYDLNLPGETITGLNVHLDKSGAIVGAAFIRDAKRKSYISGLYVFKIPVDGKSIQRSRMALTDEMYKQAYPYGEKEGIFNANRHRLTSFVIDYVFLDPDGSWIIAAEYRKEMSNYYDIQFNDILVIKVAADLNRIDWFKRLPKRQNGIQGAWDVFSYKAIQKKENYFFIFNDNLNNHDQEGNPKNIVEYDGTKAAVIMMQVNLAGDVFKIDLTSIARKKNIGAIWPSRIWEVNDKARVLIYGDRPLGANMGVAGVLFNFAWGENLK